MLNHRQNNKVQLPDALKALKNAKSITQILTEKQIPKRVPSWMQRRVNSAELINTIVQVRYRDMVISNHGMWLLVDLTWTKHLASWIGNRKVLEIMAGRGWLAKALNFHGVNITATDDFSWGVDKTNQVYEIRQYDAVEAVRSLGQEHDILLVSWSPHEDETICRACEAWGSDRPIIYIGEGQGGGNAPQEFFDNFAAIPDAPDIKIPRWWFIRDRLMIGNYEPHQ